MMKDKLSQKILENSNIDYSCVACGNKTHTYDDCYKIKFMPDKHKLFYDFNKLYFQLRHPFIRKEYRYGTLEGQEETELA